MSLLVGGDQGRLSCIWQNKKFSHLINKRAIKNKRKINTSPNQIYVLQLSISQNQT
jgi:hypothetical protein